MDDEHVDVVEPDGIGSDVAPRPEVDIQRRQARVELDDIEASLDDVAAALARMG